MFDLIAGILAWLYELNPFINLGWAIILLTSMVMVVMTPLTLAGTRSMIKMQRLQPEMKRIQQQYKDDREKMNAEMMAFYQDNGVNPVGGCLPLLFQMPVFLVLYRVISGLTRRQVDLGVDVGAASLMRGGSGASDVPVLDFPREFNPQYLSEDSSLFQDLHSQTEIPFLRGIFDLALSPLDAIRESVIDGFPYVLLLLIVLGSSLYQQRQIQGRNPNASANPQQAMLMKIMPWFLPVISLSLATALTLYFVTSNVYRIGQQGYITRSLYGSGSDQDGSAISVKSTTNGDSTGATEPKSNQADIENRRKANEAAKDADGAKAKKSHAPTKKSKPGKTDASRGKPSPNGRKGAGAGRPVPRSEASPSGRTGGTSSRPGPKKKKRN